MPHEVRRRSWGEREVSQPLSPAEEEGRDWLARACEEFGRVMSVEYCFAFAVCLHYVDQSGEELTLESAQEAFDAYRAHLDGQGIPYP